MLAAAEADPEGYCVLPLLLTTALRRSELLGLGLDTVDLDQATLDVRRTVTQVKGRAVVREVAKTKSSYRTLGIPAAVVLLLLRAQRACALESALAWGRRIFARADVLVSRNGRRAHAAHDPDTAAAPVSPARQDSRQRPADPRLAARGRHNADLHRYRREDHPEPPGPLDTGHHAATVRRPCGRTGPRRATTDAPAGWPNAASQNASAMLAEAVSAVELAVGVDAVDSLR